MDGSFGSAEAVVGCFEPLLIAELKLSQQQLLRLTASCVIDVCCCEQCALGSAAGSSKYNDPSAARTRRQTAMVV